MNNPLAGLGESWAASNAAFEATQPNLRSRLWRGVNPLTGFGSAAGAMHTAASKGDGRGMALAAASAMPVFGALKTVAVAAKGLTKAQLRTVPDWSNFGRAWTAALGVGLGSDAYGHMQDYGQTDRVPQRRAP